MDGHISRRAVLAAGVATVGGFTLAGCISEGGDPVYNSTDGVSDADVEEFTAEADADAIAATDIPIADEQLPITYERGTLEDNVADGGVGQDGIPSIDDPVFEPADEVGNRIDDGDPVYGVAHDGEAKVYPQSILVHHEIVNDEVGGESVAVTYCPLTGTAMGYLRNGVEFGVSGLLLNSNLIMYDREDESHWPQMLATAITGPLEGASLVEVPVRWATWEAWRDAYPDSLVLTEDTGYARDYGNDPYGTYNPTGGYYSEPSDPMFPPLTQDERLDPKRMVLGARPHSGPVAVDWELLDEEGVVPLAEDGDGFVAIAVPNQQTGLLYDVDEPTEWEYDGESVIDPDGDAHEVDALREAPDDLPDANPVYAYDAMWFAWAGYYPTTTLYE